MPTILSTRYKRILDAGCGMGLPSTVEAFGVDCDREAIEAGRSLAPPNVTLLRAAGEDLPFENEHFDLVFSRVVLPFYLETMFAFLGRRETF